MKIGFICPNLPGHINPMTALARQLQARDHDVLFLYSSNANGLPCIPGDKRDDMNAVRPEISKLEGYDAFSILLRYRRERNGANLQIVAKIAGEDRSRSTRSRSNPILS